MKKTVLFIFLFSALFFTAQAQKGEKQLSLGVDLGLPIGDFSKGHNFGFGASAKGLYGLTDDGKLTLTLGYMSFGMKDAPSNVSGSSNLLPILAGYRHSFNGFYLEPQLGLTVVKSKVEIEGGEDFGFGSISGSSTNLGYGIGGGIIVGDWDLGLRFQGVSADGGSLSLIGLRFAYIFSM